MFISYCINQQQLLALSKTLSHADLERDWHVRQPVREDVHIFIYDTLPIYLNHSTAAAAVGFLPNDILFW